MLSGFFETWFGQSVRPRVIVIGKQVGQDAIQLHGGMGMSHEMAVGHYFKRVSMIAATFGDTDFHLRRFAAG